MRLKSIADHHRTVNVADYLGKTAGNYDGSNDVTTLIETALVGTGHTTLEIPPGTYQVSDLTIPAAHSRNITLKPLGEAIFLHPYTAAAMQFDCQSLWLSGGSITPTAIADEDGYPSATDQRLTTITMAASGYLVGDVVHVEEDLLDASGLFYIGEYARVVATDSSTYITLNRHLYFGYTTPANIRVRRIASTAPKLRILPGIRFETLDDETSALASRTYAVHVKAAIDPEIHLEFSSAYSTAVRMAGSYMGRVNAKVRNLHVDYTLTPDATGVGVELYGSCFGTRVSVDADRAGNALIFGSSATYSGSFSANGAPMDCQIDRVRARNMVRSGINCAWAVRPKFHDVQVSASAETAGSDGAELDYGVNISAVDPWFGKLVVDGAQSAVGFRDNKGIGGTHIIEQLYHRVNAQPSGVHSPIFRGSATTGQTVGNVVVEVHGGRSSTPGSYPIERKTAETYGITARFRNFTFANCTALARSASTRPDSYHIGAGCVYDPGTGEGTREGIIDVTDTNSLDITIDDLTVIKNAASFPNGLLRGVNGLTQATKINRIVCDTGVLLPKSTADATTSVHNVTRLPPFGEQVYTDAAMAGNLAVTAGYGLLLLDPNGADRTVTLPAPATSSGLKIIVMHTGAANTLQVAGTINPAAPAAIAAGVAQTWQSDGTTWYLVG